MAKDIIVPLIKENADVYIILAIVAILAIVIYVFYKNYKDRRR